MEKTKVAIYTRVSSDEQVKGYSLDNQEEKLIAFSKLQEYELNKEHIFREEGESGFKKNRTQLDRLIQAVRRKEFDLVLVYKLDRFSRNLRNLLELVGELEENGVSFKSITETFDTSTPMGKYMLHNMGSIAELERGMIRERMVDGQIRAKKDGKWAGAAPYGYTVNKATHKLEINKEEAKIVKKMYRWLVEERMSTHGIQKRLTDLKIPTKYDNLGREKGANGLGFWRPRTVGRILTNEVYTGHFVYSKYHYLNKSKRDSDGNTRPKEEWIIIKTPKLINKEEFILAKEQIHKNSVHSTRNKKQEYLFTGLIECSKCGGKYSAKYDSSRKHLDESHLKRYTCNNTFASVRQIRCITPSITESRLEEPIWKKLVEALSNPNLAFEQLKKIQDKKIAEKDFKDKVSETELLINKKRKSLEKLLDLYLGEGIAKSVYEEKAKKLEGELKLYNNELELLKSQVVSDKEKDLRVKSILGLYERFKNNLENISYSQKREVLKMLIDKAVIKGNNIDIHCNIPYKYAFVGQTTHFLNQARRDLARGK